MHRLNPKSVGSSVIAAPDAAAAAARMVAAVNDGGVLDASRRFVLLPKPVAGSLAAAAKRLGARGMTLETTTKGQARSYRTRQHRILVRRLLLDLRMIDPEVVTPNTMTSADADTVKVAVYDSIGTGGKGVPSILRQLGPHRRFEAERMCITDMRAGALAAFDCVVFSGGTGSGQGLALGDDGRAAVARFVKGGGGYVGVCAGAYLATAKYSWGLGVLDARTVSPKWRRGRATVQAELTPEGVAIFGERGRFPVLYANGPILAPAGLEQLPDYTPLAVFRTEVARNGTPKGIMVDSPAIVAGRCGEGRVLCMSPHPEQTRGLEDFIPRAVLWTTGAGE